MAIMDCIPKYATPGMRVAALANETAALRDAVNDGTRSGTDLLLYQNLCQPQCWDAALYCAWAPARSSEARRQSFSANCA